jgi:hypothetical protein
VDAYRTRFGSAVEWLIAAAFLAATVAVATLVVQQVRQIPASPRTPTEAAEPSVVPAGIPPRAIAVPVLLLVDGQQIRIGDSLERVAETLGRAAEVGTLDVAPGSLGERFIRYYDHGGMSFVLVFEPFERGGRPLVAGIYLR